jgi:hypothetical protein
MSSAKLVVRDRLPSEGQEQSAVAFESIEQRRTRIEARAYQLAERRGFAEGAELDDWLEAERQVDGGSAMPVQSIDHD